MTTPKRSALRASLDEARVASAERRKLLAEMNAAARPLAESGGRHRDFGAA